MCIFSRRMTDAVNEIFGVCIFINVASSASMICTLCVLLITTDDGMSKIKYSLSFCANTIQIFLLSMLGEMFIIEANNIYKTYCIYPFLFSNDLNHF